MYQEDHIHELSDYEMTSEEEDIDEENDILQDQIDANLIPFKLATTEFDHKSSEKMSE